MCTNNISMKYKIFLFAWFTITDILSISNQQQIVCDKSTALKTNAVWKCVRRTECNFAKQLPSDLTINCGRDKICCPEQRKTTPTNKISAFDEANRIALDKCYEYAAYRYDNFTRSAHILFDPVVHEYNLKCIIQEPLIVGGEDALATEFPHMALLGYGDDFDDTSGNSWSCGGSLISDQFILSAAHCTGLRRGKPVKWAALGLLERTSITKDKIGTNIFKIVDRFNHPQYEGEKWDEKQNDIALYKLEKRIKLSPDIRPICIHHQSPFAINTKVSVTGWGKFASGSVESDTLQKVTIYNINPSRCSKQFKNEQTLKNGFQNKTMICGGDLWEEKDTCSGDSGGPMQIPMPGINCTWMQVGITSFGPDCAEKKPAVYTRVSAYLPWIQSIVWPKVQ